MLTYQVINLDSTFGSLIAKDKTLKEAIALAISDSLDVADPVEIQTCYGATIGFAIGGIFSLI
jgi:hypothetical protein|tara:strand:- start:49 stop:237 length:189 start_codon:yes stop_codon:yes gene_type:complete